MSKKYRLEIPNDVLYWVEPELRKRQGEIAELWDGRLHRLGWLTEIKEPLSFEEWFEKEAYKEGLSLEETESQRIKVWTHDSWYAAIKNQKPGAVVDERKDDIALSVLFDSIGAVSGPLQENPTTDTVISIWNAALKYARGIS